MKKLFYSLFFMLCAVFTTALYPAYTMASESVDKVAIIDWERIMTNSKVANDIKSQIEAKRSTLQAQFSEREKQLREKDSALASKRDVLGKEKLKEKEEEINKMAISLQNDATKERMELERVYSSAIKQVYDQTKDIVQNVSKQKNLGLVISVMKDSQVFYSDSSADITPEVLSELDKKFSKLDISKLSAGNAKSVSSLK